MGHGIHHVTAIAGEAGRNLRFYTGTLGMRLVKQTVNFDDPGAYHLYYADEAGTPGTVLTFFPWANAGAGRAGAGELTETTFRIPLASLEYWSGRLAALGVERAERFGAPVLAFRDPDGMRLALAGLPGIEAEPGWASANVPAAHAIRGVHAVSLAVGGAGPTSAILSDVFGFQPGPREGAVTRLHVPGLAVGGIVDLHAVPGPAARQGRGSVHHLAFRAADDATQAAMADTLARRHGIRATEQKDRGYFRSVYFREPGGVLFEIATDAPGFAVDEDPATLGAALKLPRFLQPHRAAIEAALPPLA